MKNKFDLTGKTALITGGCGLLGPKHAEAILEFGGNIILADIVSENKANEVVDKLNSKNVSFVHMDVTDRKSIEDAVSKYDTIDILINNAAYDPKVEDDFDWKNKFEHLDLDDWNKTIEVTLTGTFLCCQVIGNKMLSNKNGGVILNISSDLSVISPDQRIYDGGVKPASYGVAKAGVVNLTKYLSTYFAKKNIRVNALSPAGIYNDKLSDDFLSRITNLIPMGRMATIDEYKGAIVFLCSDASAYMTGHNLIVDGGRTVW